MDSYFDDSRLEDVVGFANGLHDLVLITDADEAIEATAPMVWNVAWRLRSKEVAGSPEPTEALGTWLALTAILQQPHMLVLAAQRLHDRLGELLQVDAADGDREIIAVLRHKPDPDEDR